MQEGEEVRRETISLGVGPLGDGPPLPESLAPPPDPIEERQVARSFLALGRDTRLSIGRDLGLIGETEEKLPEGVRLRHVFDQARAEDRLGELMERIDA